MGRTSKKDLKNYKQVFNDYYNNIKELKPPLNEESLRFLAKRTESFFKIYSIAVKQAKGILGKLKKVDVTKLNDENYVNGLLEGISDSSRIEESKAKIADFSAKLKCLDEVLRWTSNLSKFFGAHKNLDQDALSEFGKEISPIWKEIFEKYSTEIAKSPKVCLSANNLYSFCENLSKASKNSNSATNDYSYINSLKDLANRQAVTLKKDVGEEQKLIKSDINKLINDEEEYNNLQKIKKNSLTLSGIKLAKKQPTLENIIAVIERSRKNHPIVLGAISRKINSKLKSLKFKKLDFSQVN